VPPGLVRRLASNTVIVPAQGGFSADTRPRRQLPHQWIEAKESSTGIQKEWRPRCRSEPRRRSLLSSSFATRRTKCRLEDAPYRRFSSGTRSISDSVNPGPRSDPVAIPICRSRALPNTRNAPEREHRTSAQERRAVARGAEHRTAYICYRPNKPSDGRRSTDRVGRFRGWPWVRCGPRRWMRRICGGGVRRQLGCSGEVLWPLRSTRACSPFASCLVIHTTPVGASWTLCRSLRRRRCGGRPGADAVAQYGRRLSLS
jgi:hypothetical protein